MAAPGLQIGSTVTLANGVEMPMLGLGVWQAGQGVETQRAVATALEVGYRHVDTARAYRNEADVGAALRESGLPRGKLFVTTKLWNTDHGYDRALQAIDKSLASLGLEQVDLYLVHWPVEGLRGETWRAMERILSDGKARAIGVSNYTVAHLEELLATATVPPAVNQVEFNPFLHQQELLAFCQRHAVQLEAYAPLVRGQRMGHPVVARIAVRHGRTPGQVLLRWALQHGLVVIPKSVHPDRIRENADLYGFALDDGDMAELDGLDEGHRTCWDPTDVP
jgi:diketogulonate reductase-like aldo/keto reductase